MTPHAASTIIRQIESKSDVWDEYYDDVTGKTFNVGFSADCERQPAFHPYAGGYSCQCVIIGAWSDDDNGDVTFAGNRAELVSLIGEKVVAQWEDDQGDKATERAAA